jgi:two-component system, NarL family, sensor histidine kinase DevS
LITELRPAALDQIGLAPALDALLKRVGATSGIDIEADIATTLQEGSSPTRLDPEVEGTLYRLVQESLTNAVKHASAGKVKVVLAEEGEHVGVTVADDGAGFDPQAATEGFGLVGMHERVALVGGELTVDSTPGHGTTVRARVPARQRENVTVVRGLAS